MESNALGNLALRFLNVSACWRFNLLPDKRRFQLLPLSHINIQVCFDNSPKPLTKLRFNHAPIYSDTMNLTAIWIWDYARPAFP